MHPTLPEHRYLTAHTSTDDQSIIKSLYSGSKARDGACEHCPEREFASAELLLKYVGQASVRELEAPLAASGRG